MQPLVDYTIEGRRVRTALLWRAPQELRAAQEVIEGFDRPSSDRVDWVFMTENLDALLANVLMWLLDPDQPFTGLRECGRGSSCDRERFYFRRRKYCCPEHHADKRRDYKEREKAVKQLSKQLPRRSPSSARDLIDEVKKPGLSAEQLVGRAQAEAARKHK
jgi:hypothetical protein